MSEPSVWPDDRWLSALAAGDAEIEKEFWATYAGPLHRVAERQLSQRLKQRVDADDVVQSACRTFFRRVRQGEFELADRSDLWRLLLTITLNKARMQARFHGRARRGIDREQSIELDPQDRGTLVENELDQIDFNDFLDSILAKLDEEQQVIFQRTLDHQRQDEIAEALGCSVRTVRRLQKDLREHLQAVLADELTGES